MFTGLTESIGKIASVSRDTAGMSILILSTFNKILNQGESVLVDGVCLTVSAATADGFSAYLSQETIDRTTFKKVFPNKKVNLELPLSATSFLGGHLVSGHVDTTGTIISNRTKGETKILSIRYPTSFSKYVVEKGSIAVNGVSLTISKAGDTNFEIVLIPETIKRTNLGTSHSGDLANLEFDMIAKYIERIISKRK